MMSSESEVTQNKMWANPLALILALNMFSSYCLLLLLASASVTYLRQLFKALVVEMRGAGRESRLVGV